MPEFSHFSTPDAEWLKAAATLPAETEVLPFDVQRRQASEAAKEINKIWDPPMSGLQVSDTTIPVQGASIPVRTYVPEDRAGKVPFPILVWFHGGGFTVGDVELDDALLRLICVKRRISCVNVDYRLAPEHKFPTPLEDCYGATKWAATNASSLSADVERGFLVGGVSAGANLAAVVALRARDDPGLSGKLTGQILQMPAVCPHTVYPEKWKAELLSIDQNKDGPLLTREEMVGVYADYGPPDLTSPDVAPLLASSHRNLPPVYIQVCGLDPLRDEAFLYEKVLRESDVPTGLDIYPGQPHGFYDVDPKMTACKKWREDVLKAIQWLIESKDE